MTTNQFMSHLVCFAVALVAIIHASESGSTERRCGLSGGTYRLVDNPNFELVFEDYNGIRASFSINDRGKRFLAGTVGASQGWPINFIFSDTFDEDLSFPVTMTFLDEHLKDLGEFDEEMAARYIVIPLLTPALYYSDANKTPSPFPRGAVWERFHCGSVR